jgi:hypothetical protein
MATVYTTQAAKQNDPHPKNLLTSQETTPRQSVLLVDYTIGTTETGDVLNLIKLPKGAIINPIYSWVVSSGDVAATSATITVGANGDADALSSALNIDGAGRDQFALNVPVTLTSESYITATFAISGAVVAATTLTFHLHVTWPA